MTFLSARMPEQSRPVAASKAPESRRPGFGLVGHSHQLAVSSPGDSHEREADRVAGLVTRPLHEAACGRCVDAPYSCPDCLTRRPNGLSRSSPGGGPQVVSGPFDLGVGRPLDAGTRGFMESRIGADFEHVRVYTGAKAAKSAARLAARAFTYGDDIAFATGQYAPDGPAGQRLLAHELVHVVQGGAQVSRQPATDEVDAAATIVANVRKGDVAAVASELEKHSGDPALGTIREKVSAAIGQPVERWLLMRSRRSEAIGTAASFVFALGGASYIAPVVTSLVPGGQDSPDSERGLRVLWPVLSLIEKLHALDEGYRELEQAQLDVIRSATEEQRVAARSHAAELEAIYREMEPMEEFQARKLIDPSADSLYRAAGRVLSRAPGNFHDDEDMVFDALVELNPSRRRAFFFEYWDALYDLLSKSRFRLLETLCTGTEVEALIARLREATEGRRDDQAAVSAVVERAVSLLRERAELRATVDTLPPARRAEAHARLGELDNLDDLLRFSRTPNGSLDGSTFLGIVSAATDDAAGFAAAASQLSAFAPRGQSGAAYEIAKQRILLSDGDVRTIENALTELHAPRPTGAMAPAPTSAAPMVTSNMQVEDERLRNELLVDPAVAAVINRLKGSDRQSVGFAVRHDAFAGKLAELNDALNAADWGRFFRLALEIARNDGWRSRFRATSTENWSVYSNVRSPQREIMETILRTKGLPLDALSEFFGHTLSGGAEGMVSAVEDIGESDRSMLRRGYALSMHPPIGPPSSEQESAIAAYRAFDAQLRKSRTTLGMLDESGYQRVSRAVLGSMPTADEWVSCSGRFRAAQLMYDQEQASLALDRGVSQHFTETDETAVAAAREFASRFEPLRSRGALEAVDLFVLASLHERFLGRSAEFTEASNAISDMAGMVAATVAGIVVVAATGGLASPGVIALAAASGAGARVVTKEMFGGAFADVGGRDVLLGAVDGALAVVGASLASRGTELVGLGGHALTSSAARLGGEVVTEAAEFASQSGVNLARRVAASGVQTALDGAFSGAVSDAFSTMTTPGAWRRGVWRGLIQVGESALFAGLTGLATGGLMGGAAPLAGAGLSKFSEALAMRGIQSTLTRVGAIETLEAARVAASVRDLDTANRLLRELEAHLTADESRTLRRHLYEEMQSALGHPAGTAAPATEADAHLLADSGAVVDGRRLRPAELQAELDVVRRSEPRPSTVDGYVDEVDVGNSHAWRRREDGTWCRFSESSLCGTVVPGAPAVAAAQRARMLDERVDRLRTQLGEYGRRPGRAREAARLRSALDEMAMRGDASATRDILDSIEDALSNERLPTSAGSFTVEMNDSRVRKAFNESLAAPGLQGNPEWDAYLELIRSRYATQGSVEIGRSPRSIDPANVAGTDEMRARFLAGLGDRKVSAGAADMTLGHLRSVVKSAGSEAGAVAAGDAIWIDRLTGGRLERPGPNASLWPADPVWGVWRVDHIVELQHGGLETVSNYAAVPQRMHAVKSDAMNEFRRVMLETR
jgi:Domain of unknown function (DUF4157)